MTTIQDITCPFCDEFMESDCWTMPDETHYIGCSVCDYWYEVDDGYPDDEFETDEVSK